MSRELREVAQRLVDEYNWDALDNRERIREWLGDLDLLSPLGDPDPRADRAAIDFVESHARWLLS